ncbi:DUF4136 domain-containing protein [Altibacter sp. HG106]|uniref:DUF4136 domain-containing protein n=1 Tax=Altibacter sp. HG106 TaxID=3023937 RepID=UPI002350CCB7|nr:DUF4136 domain-containing protein [Altibacter sp. HG106]MDC7995968.1 DUF4136 domain-containing protein [Altibacter sp. HG106]
MKPIFLFVISIFLFSCGTTVAVDYDKETNFSQYTTYNYYPNIESGLNDLDNKRIMRLTDSLLQSRGWERAATPQLFINFYASEQLSVSRNTIGFGFGSGGGNVGVGVGGGIPIGGRNIDQVLTFDLIDVSNDALIWQAKAEGHYKEKASPEQKVRYYENTLQKILKKYPPKA